MNGRLFMNFFRSVRIVPYGTNGGERVNQREEQKQSIDWSGAAE